MDAEKLIAHVETLAPGIVTLALLGATVPGTAVLMPNSMVLQAFQQPFLTGLVFVAAAYLLGSAIFIFSRFTVDTLSAYTFRPFLLKLYRWSDFDSLSPIYINRKFRDAIDHALSRDEKDPIRQEVLVRRQRGRLLRTLLVPMLLLLNAWDNPGLLLASLALLVAIYSYSELTIYQEARIAA